MKAVGLCWTAPLFAVFGFLLPPLTLGQGQFVINNRVPPDINARFVLCSDPAGTSSLASSAYHVDILAGRDELAFDPSKALVSITTDFRTGNAAGYINPLTVTVPGMYQPQQASVRVRAYQGDSWEASPARYEGIFMVTLDEAPGAPNNLPMGTSTLVLCDHAQPRPEDELDHWTWSGTIASDLTAITYGLNRFVAVGSSSAHGNIFVSPDGHRWTRAESPGTNDLLRVAQGSDRFIAVGKAGAILTSPDAFVWTKQNSGTTTNLWSVAYGAGQWIAVGEGRTVVASSDGVSWEPRFTGSALPGNYTAIAYGNGQFYVSGNGAASISSDRRAWTEVYNDDQDVVFANGQFISLADRSVHIFTIAPDGRFWTFPGPYANLWARVGDAHLQASAYGEGKFVIVSDKLGIVAVSTNGTDWVTAKAPTHSPLLGVAYGQGLFVAVGSQGALLTSEDGLHWAREGAGNSGWFLDVTSGNGAFVVVGAADQLDDATLARRRILSSTNGLDWTEAHPLNDALLVEAQPVRAVTYGAGRFVAVSECEGSASEISTNGLDWVTAASLAGGSDVAYGNGQFMSAGPDSSGLLGPGVSISEDGLNWERILQNPIAEDLRTIAFGQKGFEAIGQNGAFLAIPGLWWANPWELSRQYGGWNWNGIAYGASDYVAVGDNGRIQMGNGWFQRVVSPTTNDLYAVTYGTSQFVAVGAGGTILTSANTVNWIPRQSGTTNDLYGVTYANGRFLVVGANGTILQSPRPTYLELSSIRRDSSGIHAQVSGQPGTPLKIQASVNLIDWTVLQLLTRPPDGVITLDGQSGLLPFRFYRALAP